MHFAHGSSTWIISYSCRLWSVYFPTVSVPSFLVIGMCTHVSGDSIYQMLFHGSLATTEANLFLTTTVLSSFVILYKRTDPCPHPDILHAKSFDLHSTQQWKISRLSRQNTTTSALHFFYKIRHNSERVHIFSISSHKRNLLLSNPGDNQSTYIHHNFLTQWHRSSINVFILL